MAKMSVSLSDSITRRHLCSINDVIDNDVTDNDVTDSWMNMHTLLASRPNVVASMRVDATRCARCERGLRPVTALHCGFGFDSLQ